ncbi:MAG: hypothetical protein JJE04_21165 [Acidobacteriia bacterium]|nr:hypothetical protein [Terriglobia bacterium]
MKHWPALLLLVSACPAFAASNEALDLAASLRKMELDPEECYRVREIHFSREDFRFYLTEGYLIFGKPVAGRRLSAVFSADVEGGDAELLLLPPSRGERLSLSAFTQSPNLNEHFSTALMLFTDDTAETLMAALRARGELRRSSEQGLLLAGAYNPVLSNLSASFAVRLLDQILSAKHISNNGIFYAAIQGKRLGNFDTYYDPEARDSIYVGQLKYRDNRAYYDTWTSFPARPFRDGKRTLPGESFSLSNYRIQADLNSELYLKAITQATITPLRGNLPVFGLDISTNMKVTSVRVNGEEAQLFSPESFRANLIRRNDAALFLVIPPQSLEQGRHYEVQIEHEGAVVRPAGKDVYFVGSRANWYPRSSMQFARFDITFSYPARLQMLFPGDIKEDHTGEGIRTTRRITPSLIRVAGFNLGNYNQTKITRGDLTVEVYANKELDIFLLPPRRETILLPPPPGPWPQRGSQRRVPETLPVPPRVPDPASRLESLATEVAAAFEFFNANLGPPALNTLMVSPIPGGFGQGFPGLVYLSTISYLNPADRPASSRGAQQQQFFSELLHAHETAHQWWGNVVSSASPQEDWLMEALSNYSSLLMLEKKKGARSLAAALDRHKEQLLERDKEGATIESAGPIRLGGRLQSSLAPDAWRTIVYGKGAWIMHMLRSRLGLENFLKLLGEICKRYRFQPLSVAQFQELAAAYMPKGSPDPKLDAFFDHWVENTGIPSLHLASSVRGKAPGYKLTLTLTQSGVDEHTSLQVPVEVRMPGGKSQIHWLATGKEPSTLTLALKTKPVKVTLDPGNAILRN